jgi:galactonate dehydratase
MVVVETSDGTYGVGESGVSGRELAVKGAIDHFRQSLLGKDPMRISTLWQELYRSQYFEGGRVLTGAISAIDIALYDLAGKKLGVPVFQLLGGQHRGIVQCFVTAREPVGPEAPSAAEKLVKAGWRVIRFAPARQNQGPDGRLFEPRDSIATTANWLNKVREQVGPSPVLGLDYHHRLSVAEAASFCGKLNRDTLDFLEEPIRAESPEAYVSLRTMVAVPFAIGEESSSKWAFLPFVERGITNFARIDVCNIGGFTESMKVAGSCEAHYVDLMPHNPLGPVSTAANIQLAAAVPNYAWLELQGHYVGNPEGFDKALFPKQPKLEGTGFRIPDSPGLGIEFDFEAASKDFKPWEPPHWHREDGSYTNW